MPICDIWCYTLQDSHNKLEACRVDGKSWKLRRVFFGCVYPFFLFFNHLYSVFVSMVAHHVLQQQWNMPNLLTYLFHLFPFSSYLSVKQYLTLYLNFLRRKNILRSLEILGRENLDLSLKWALDNRKRFRIITELILSFDINRLKIYLFFSEHRKE